MRYELVGRGALRFRGKAAMRDLMELLRGDDSYTWSIPTGWPAPSWIDVYPNDKAAEALLLQIVAE